MNERGAAATGAYVGRFAPSPTGLLHAGSLVAALASWLDARAHGGAWRVRIEDLDVQRNVMGAAEGILAQLDRCGLRPDGEVLRQSARIARYEAALARLVAQGHAYPCACSRRDLRLAASAAASAGIDEATGEAPYPGTCRRGLGGRPARSMRLRVDALHGGAAGGAIEWLDRRLGPQRQDVARMVGDFVLKRADGVFAYQLAVVVDDAEQGVTDVVRGEDLVGSTARQIVLQRLLGLATPRYLHAPLVRAPDGSKLSKQTGARPLAPDDSASALRDAAAALGLDARGTRIAELLDSALSCWRQRFGPKATLRHAVGHDR
jgi:glutamyl-Q tRNA(Asp) synthetase